MGGVLVEVTGTAYGDPQTFYDAWQRALTVKAGFIGGFANDCIDTEIDGQVITIRREFLVRPDQMTININIEPPPPSTLTRYVNTSSGTPLNMRARPTVSGLLVRKLARGDRLEIEAGFAVPADGFTWVRVLIVNGVAVSSGALWYVVDKYLGPTDPN